METLITAHTGADGRPDNSLEFVAYALESGADALEVDVRRQGERLAIGHDAIGAGAPPLEEVFRMAAAYPGVKVNCDLKEPGLEEAAARLAEREGLAERLIFSGTVDAFRRVSCGEVYLNLEEYVPDLYLNYREIPNFELQAAETVCGVCKRAGIRTVNMYQGIVTRRFAELLAGEGIGISAWTVDGTWELEWFLNLGVRNITTRRAKMALELRAARKR